jgi:hypothetical protein
VFVEPAEHRLETPPAVARDASPVIDSADRERPFHVVRAGVLPGRGVSEHRFGVGAPLADPQMVAERPKADVALLERVEGGVVLGAALDQPLRFVGRLEILTGVNVLVNPDVVGRIEL